MEQTGQAAQKAATAPTHADKIVAAVEKLLHEAPKGEIWPQNVDSVTTSALAAVRRQALSLDNGATLIRVSMNILGIVAHALGRLDVPLAFIETSIGDFGLTINTMVHVRSTTTPTPQQ